MIDYIITNRNVHPTQILDVRTLNSGTDHNLVLYKVRLKTRIMKIRQNAGYTTNYNIESLETASTRNLYQRRLAQK